MKINVIGAGTWGLTLGCMLSEKGHDVIIWQRDKEKNRKLRASLNYKKLPNLKISDTIVFTSNYKDLYLDSLNIIAIPSHSINCYFTNNNNHSGQYLIASKGYDLTTGKLPVELLNLNFNIQLNDIAVISGPNHAEEISLKKASAAVIASNNSSFSNGLQKLFFSDFFRVYTSNDIIGVQVGGSIKNVIAIAAGICVGLKLGDNTQAALVSRGMNEILQLNKIYNININTLYGLSGLGDLIATCYSKYSRNRNLGILIGKGYSTDDAISKIGMVSEGVNTTKILNHIITKHKLIMPICQEVYKILFNSYDPKNSINNLMQRSLKDESMHQE